MNRKAWFIALLMGFVMSLLFEQVLILSGETDIITTILPFIYCSFVLIVWFIGFVGALIIETIKENK